MVIGLALLLGLTVAFAIPAIQAMVPDLVDPADLAPAMAMSSLTFNLARAVGPVVGALVVAHWGIAVAFGFNSLSYLGLIAGLLAVRPRQAPRAPGPALRWRDSLRLVRDDAALVALLAVVAAISLSQDPVSTLTPGFSSEVFHRADTMTGLLVGAFGAGSALAAVTVAGRVRDPVRRLAPGCLLMGLGMLGFGLAPTLPFAFGALAVGGFWSLFAVQTPGAPRLTIRLTTTNTALVSWPLPSTGFTLQENADLRTTNWVAPPQTVFDNGTDKFIIVNPPAGNRFYRLFKP